MVGVYLRCMPQVYILARKIHRISLFFVVVLGLVQLTTGIMMKYGIGNLLTARSLHNAVSIYFALAFAIQMLTGIYMYIHPFLLRIRHS